MMACEPSIPVKNVQKYNNFPAKINSGNPFLTGTFSPQKPHRIHSFLRNRQNRPQEGADNNRLSAL